MSHGDLAYSTEGLPAHTDTTYFTDPAGLQIFHMLSHPPPGAGGTSLLVDGFYAANLLRELSPSSYATLSRLRIPAHASGTPGTMLRPTISQPVFRHDENGELAQVRWNNEDRGVIGQGWSPDDVRAWYKAAKEFERLLKGEDTEYWVQLSPGTMVGAYYQVGGDCILADADSNRQLAGDARPIPLYGVKTDVRSICWRRRLEVETDGYQAGAVFGQRRCLECRLVNVVINVTLASSHATTDGTPEHSGYKQGTDTPTTSIATETRLHKTQAQRNLQHRVRFSRHHASLLLDPESGSFVHP